MAEAANLTAAHTFGAILRGHDLPGLSVEEVLMPAGLAVPEHRHRDAQIYFLLEGQYAETVGGARHALRPGGIWFRPPREPHRNEVVGNAAALTLIVTIEEHRFARLAAGAGARPLPGVLLDEVRQEMLRELRCADAAATVALEGWALLLLARADRILGGNAGPAGPDWLQGAKSYLDASFRGPVSLAGAAAQVGVHPATLAAAFRRILGTSVGEYVRELRLRAARRDLADSRLPVAEIALQNGFYDQAHLGRCFRRRFGTSPAAFRAGARRAH